MPSSAAVTLVCGSASSISSKLYVYFSCCSQSVVLLAASCCICLPVVLQARCIEPALLVNLTHDGEINIHTIANCTSKHDVYRGAHRADVAADGMSLLIRLRGREHLQVPVYGDPEASVVAAAVNALVARQYVVLSHALLPYLEASLA